MVREPADPADAEAMEAKLRGFDAMELLGLLHHSSNYTFLARLSEGGEELLAVYKPARGESPLWDFPPETLYRREVASYLLAKALGWPRVPATVVRERAPHGVGAVQLFIDADPRRHYLNAGLPSETWERVALFDFVTNNADRKAGHCLVDSRDRAWVIDHGLTFHVEPKLRTVIWDFAGERPARELRADLQRLCPQLESGELGERIREMLSRSEMRALTRRVAEAARPDWTFPQPGSSWAVPWPPI